MTNPDMGQFLSIYLDEGFEQLSALEASCIELEKGTQADETVQVMFRAAHTLKGSSQAMGFTGTGDLTHEMENVLDDLRNHRMELSTEVVDALLACLDVLRGMLDSIRDTGAELDSLELGAPVLIKRLSTLRSGQVDIQQGPKRDISLPPGSGSRRVLIRISPTCPMKGLRASVLLEAIRPEASVALTIPSEADLWEEKFEESFIVEFADVDPTPQLLAFIKELPEVDDVLLLSEADELKPQPVEEAKAETATAGPAQVAKKEVHTEAHGQTVRIQVGRLDNLLNLVGELVTYRTRLANLVASVAKRLPKDDQVLNLEETLGRLESITGELQSEVMKSRLLPVDQVFQRMPRVVRDVSHDSGKNVDLRLEGGETELDRSILDILGDPLIHILRNAVDHGVEAPNDRAKAGKPETGTITLRASRDPGEIIVEIIDDGRGIDPVAIKAAAVKKGVLTEAAAGSLSDREAVELIFAPGFSTAEKVSGLSGRGVGMDIARTSLERIGGKISILTEIGEGSTFRIHLPLTIAIIRAVLVRADGVTLAVPVSTVSEIIDLQETGSDISKCTLGGSSGLLLRKDVLSLANLADSLQGSCLALEPERNFDRPYAVVVHHGKGKSAFSVDALIGEQEVVIKPLGKLLGGISGISGASILGDGNVALIVDPARLVQDLHRSAAA